MIFFMVKKYFILNFAENNDNNDSPGISECNNDKVSYNPNNENPNYKDKNDKEKYPYVKVLVSDPYNNRDIILKITKKQKGVYV